MAQDNVAAVRKPAETILARGEQTLHEDALSGALSALAFVAWSQGRARDGCGLLRASIRRAESGAVALRVYPQLAMAAMLTAIGEFAEADALIAKGREELESAGPTTWADAPAALHARLLLVVGRTGEAVAEAESALATAERTGTWLFAPLAHSTIATTALLRGEIDEAARRLELCDAIGEVRTGFGHGDSDWISARIVDARDGASAALSASTRLYDDAAVQKRVLVENPAAAAWLVRVALEAGDVMRAQRVIACARQLAAENDGVTAIETAAIHARGISDQEPGALAHAAAAHTHPWAAASASEDLAAVLERRHSGPGSIEALEHALTAYQEAGAPRDAARICRRMEQAGGSSRASRPVEGWDSLTPTERRVARNVSDAMTNRAVAERMRLSPHTIDVHLRHIFHKLNIRSRVALARIVLSRGNRAASEALD